MVGAPGANVETLSLHGLNALGVRWVVLGSIASAPRGIVPVTTAAGRETWVTPASFFIGAAKREGRQK